MGPSDARQYRSYLLRIWKARADHETWRASLERVGSGERHNFSSLPELFEYLQQMTQAPASAVERMVDGDAQNEGS